jgi:hypothetical protein
MGIDEDDSEFAEAFAPENAQGEISQVRFPD